MPAGWSLSPPKLPARVNSFVAANMIPVHNMAFDRRFREHLKTISSERSAVGGEFRRAFVCRQAPISHVGKHS